MLNATKTEKIQSILKNLPASKLEGLKNLFWEELNYDHENKPLSTSGWDAGLVNLLAAPPVLFASAGADNRFHVLYGHLQGEKLSVGSERALINELIKGHSLALFIFSNQAQTQWHFINAIYEQDEKAHKRRVLRRISVSPEDRLRTASERMARLDAALVGRDLFGVDAFQIQKLHEDAFNVEAVTEEFFEDYKGIFTLLKNNLEQQTGAALWAHDFALQFLNRLMFLYYIERKRWLGGDADFLHNFWRAYRHAGDEPDSFVRGWLDVLFFEAFNKTFAAGRSDMAHIPQNFRDALQLAPYLNGGLFTRNKLDTDQTYLIKDALVKDIFDFLDQYNFTISEDTPLDQEVAVDPEMIGKVYESLVNVSAEADGQGDAGIFYTPRIEIDLMCRLSLVDWLANHLSNVQKSALYEFVFAFSPQDKQAADSEISRLNLWPQLDQLLCGVTVLDPACGSGSFLVGMLMILDDLLMRCANALGRQETPYERRKHIVGSSLYGVDIMEWAVHVAELRLWLQLVIDTELDENELRLRPLLPNLSFKLRRGDSLVQELGGLNFGLRRAGGQLKRELAGKITTLKAEKLKFFNNDPARKYQSKAQLENAEHQLFTQIIEEELKAQRLRRDELNLALAPKTNLFGELQDTQMKLEAVNQQRELEQVNEAISKLEPALQVLKTSKTIPFVWDVSFVEIFEGDNAGFDIVVGNPPYVRQERIHDPALPPELITPENKRDYKAKLARAVYATYPHTFGYRPGEGRVSWALDRKSDYYIYFYFIGLSLLNDRGAFCFITSNSWLDVGYGADLQQFLLTRSQVKLILDNQVKRSFKSADVNTIIALLAPPVDARQERPEALAHAARFVMFRVPFENGLSAVLWEEVEEAAGRVATPETRILVKTQQDLLTSGLDPENGKYAGDKWGGKYLRAPDIYWDILIRNEDKLLRLPTLIDLNYGIKPGAVKYFYITEEIINRFEIEQEFLRPIITSSQNLNSLVVVPDCNLLYCHEPLNSLKGTGVYNYIRWGEETGVNRIPSVASHTPYWYSLNGEPFDLLLFQFWDRRFWTPYSQTEQFCSNNFFYGRVTNYDKNIIACLLNSSFHFFQINIMGRTNQGQGVLTTYGPDLSHILVINPEKIDRKELIPMFKNLVERDVLPIQEELKQNDRIMFDSVIFKLLGMTKDQIDDFYLKYIHLVESRIARAKSIN